MNTEFAYMNKLTSILDEVYETNKDKIKDLAEKFAENIMEDRIIHTFGTGHSHMIGIELFPKAGSGIEWMLYSVFGGGLMLGAIFMATDYATSPVTKKGQVIYGIGCGLLTVFIRYFGALNEGVCYSIMVMNCCTALIDKYTKPTRFGVVKSDKKEAAK